MAEAVTDQLAQSLRELWSVILDIDKDEIKGDSNFFDLGADSVAAIRLLSHSVDYGIQLDASVVYFRPTFSEMLKGLKKAPETLSNGHSDITSEDPRLKQWAAKECGVDEDVVEDIYPCTALQRTFMKSHLDHGGYVCQAVYRLSGPLERFYRAWNMMAQNPIFRTRIVQTNDEWYQVVVKEETTWFHGHDVAAYKVRDKSRKMNLGRPLSRQAIVYENGQVWFIWTVLHVVHDGWTRRLMYEDLRKCFEDQSFLLQAPSRPPFREYNDGLQKMGSSEGLAYWSNVLNGLKRFDLLYPASWNKRQIASARLSKVVKVPTPQDSSIRLTTLAHAAWALVLSTVSGVNDIFFVSHRSGRAGGMKNVDAILGPMLATVPFRVEVQPEMTVQEFLRHINKLIIDGAPYEPWGREAMYRYFGHNKALQTNLLPQLAEADMVYNTVTGTENGVTTSMTPVSQDLTPYEVGLLLNCYPRGDDQQYMVAMFDEELIPFERMDKTLDIYASAQAMLSQRADSAVQITTVLAAMREQYSPALNHLTNDVQHEYIKPETLEDLISSKTSSAALVVPHKLSMSISSFQLQDLISKTKTILIEQGVCGGQTITVSAPNSLEFLVLFFSITSLGAIIAPLNQAYKQAEFEFYLRSSSSTLMIISRDFHNNRSAVQAANETSVPAFEMFTDGTNVELNPLNEHKTKAILTNGHTQLSARPEDVALLLYTSGTTGAPKAVPLTHRNLLHSASTVRDTYHLEPSDRSLLIMPLFHIHGLVAGMLAPLLSQGTLIISSSVAPGFWELASRNRTTWFTCTPTMHKMVSQLPQPSAKPNLRFVRSCSSPLSPALFAELEKMYNAPVLEAYAMTEAAHQMTSNQLGVPGVPGSVGKPTGIEMIVLLDNDSIAPVDVSGEICIRGPNVMSGYLNNPEANKRAFTPDGFLRTGDQGKKDANGLIWLTGRIKELINKGGEKISPIEIDNVISKHEAVSEAVSFAVPDEMYGEVVGVAIICKDGCRVAANELKKWLRERISAHKVPSHFYFPESMPRTATGKVQRLAIRQKMIG